MAPPPGYTAAGVWHTDFPPRALIDSTTGEDGKAVAWRKRGKAQDTAAVAAAEDALMNILQRVELLIPYTMGKEVSNRTETKNK